MLLRCTKAFTSISAAHLEAFTNTFPLGLKLQETLIMEWARLQHSDDRFPPKLIMMEWARLQRSDDRFPPKLIVIQLQSDRDFVQKFPNTFCSKVIHIQQDLQIWLIRFQQNLAWTYFLILQIGSKRIGQKTAANLPYLIQSSGHSTDVQHPPCASHDTQSSNSSVPHAKPISPSTIPQPRANGDPLNHFGLFNIDGLKPRSVSSIPFLQDRKYENNMLFVMLTETWLSDHVDAELHIKNYSIYQVSSHRIHQTTNQSQYLMNWTYSARKQIGIV